MSADGSTATVDYSDGEVEENVDVGLIRLQDGAEALLPKDRASLFSVGTVVTARYCGWGEWLLGTISQVTGSGPDLRVNVVYAHDGDKDVSLPLSCIKFVTSGITSGSEGPRFKDGQDVEVLISGQSRWCRGKIRSVDSNGVCDVTYNDRHQARGVRPEYIRPVRGQPEPAKSQGSNSSSAPVPATKYLVDDVVRVPHLGKGRWYQGTVVTVLASSDADTPPTYEVEFDDGSPGSNVPEDFMKLVKRPTGLDTGATIEANYRGRGKWFRGKITKASAALVTGALSPFVQSIPFLTLVCAVLAHPHRCGKVGSLK
jgi:hypothetical protein